MKAPLTKVSLALLAAVFVLACQDLGSGPVGPDGLVPQFAKVDKNCDPDEGAVHPSCKDDGGGGGEEPTTDPTWTVHMSGRDMIVGEMDDDNAFIDEITDARPGAGKLGTSIKFGTVSAFKMIFLSEDFLTDLEEKASLVPGDINNCFGLPGDGGFRGHFNLVGSLRFGKGDVVTAQYTLHALGTDGETEVGYGLEMTGLLTSGSAPFAPGENQTVKWDGVAIFHAQGDAPACVGGGGMHSAQKEVDISGDVTIMGNS